MKKTVEPFETKLRKTGSAAGVTIPAEYLRQLSYEIGDTLRVNLESDGLRITKIDDEFDNFMELYDFVEARFSPALSRLFK